MACSTTSEDPIALAEKNRVVTPESVAVVGPLIVPGQQPATSEIRPEPQVNQETEGEPPVKQTEPAKVQAKAKPTVITPAKQKVSPSTKKNPSSPPSIKPTSLPSPEPVKAAQKFGQLGGNITLIGDESSDLNPKGVIVLMEPLGSGISLPVPRIATTHYIDMKDKTYLPRHLTISRNDRISFINKDRIKHNVFSSTGKNAFDLGTYGAGLQREVSLNATGVVKVYCNIHPEMATFIGVSESGLTALTDDAGHFIIQNIKPGRYEVTYWHIRGETTETITIEAGKTAKVAVKINTDNPSSLEHANKFGKKYNKNAAIFDDEFY